MDKISLFELNFLLEKKKMSCLKMNLSSMNEIDKPLEDK